MLQRVLKLGIIASILLLSAPTASANPQNEGEGYIIEHTIESGQLLNRIATQYNTTIAKIVELNPGLEPDKIKVGQKIKIQPNTNTKTAKPAEEKPAVAEEKPTAVEEKPTATEEKVAEVKEEKAPTAEENRVVAEEKPAAAEKKPAEKKAAESSKGEIIEHVVEKGQFFSHIVSIYKTSTAKILELNPGLDPDKIRAGQKIKVQSNIKVSKPSTEKPAGEAKPSQPVAEQKAAEPKAASEEESVPTIEYIEHTVGVGERFSHIVVKYHTTTVKILKHNPGLEPAKVYAGQKIKIPTTVHKKSTSTAAKEDPNGTYHTIVSGDTLSKIAEKYSTSITKLKELNEGLEPDKIRIGQKLRVK